MAKQKEDTSREMRAKQLGAKNLSEWDMVHNLAQLIKQGKANIVRNNRIPHTVIKQQKVFRCKV